ncbi:MAG TPA: hypothetical protein VIE63_17970 [Ramlibacter sp.]
MSAVLQNTMTNEDDLHRQAYNSAFDELGLAWHWDRATYAWLPDGPDRVRTYVEREHPHLLRAYEPDFLVAAVENARARCQAMLESRRAARTH